MGSQPVTADDVGKRIVYEDDTVGRLVEYTDGTAYVDPDPDLTDTVRSKLGWGHADEESFPLQRELVDEVTDDEIRLMARL
jgi:hypothetical protein